MNNALQLGTLPHVLRAAGGPRGHIISLLR